MNKVPLNEQQAREILSKELKKRDLKIAAGCALTGGAIIGNSPLFGDAVIAAIIEASK